MALQPCTARQVGIAEFALSPVLLRGDQHRLQQEHNLVSHLLSPLLIKPRGDQQERLKKQPPHDQRAHRSHCNPGVHRSRERRLLPPRAGLTLLSVK